MKKTILIMGGENDQEIISIKKIFEYYNKANIISILLGPNFLNNINWDIDNDILYLNNEKIYPNSIFIRQNVFAKNINYQIQAKRWHNLIQGWALSHPDVKILNYNWLNKFSNKTFNLFIAKKFGFKIPETNITNNITLMKKKLAKEKNNFILKPIDNGFCFDANEAINNCKFKIFNNIKTSSTPAFFQKKIRHSEYRLYWVIDDYFIFKIESNSLDHRIKQDGHVKFLKKNIFPDKVINNVKKIINFLKLDFACIDFKFDGNDFIFLEINDFPMFSYFDKISDLKISTKIYNFLSQ